MSSTLIVDGTNLLVRSQHAMMGQTLSVEVDGIEVNTGPVHAFINMLAKYVRQVDPTHMVVCWDGGRSSFRTALYPEYKGDRSERGEEDGIMFTLAKEFLSLAGIHHVTMDGVEADDLVAGYWRRHRLQDVTILSGDKDFLQLVDEYPGFKTVQIRPGVEPEVWDHSVVKEKMGCPPWAVPAVMALTGDKGDGVPGVRGIGQKTAVKLLEAYDWNLEKLIASEEKKVDGQADIIRLSHRLVDLRSSSEAGQVGFAPPFNPTRAHNISWRPLLDWCHRYEMSTLAERLLNGVLWPDYKLA